MNDSEHNFAQTVALANGRTLRVVADAPDSIRLEEWQTDVAPTYSVVLTNRDMYKLWNAMVEALRRTHIHEARAAPSSPPLGVQVHMTTSNMAPSRTRPIPKKTDSINANP